MKKLIKKYEAGHADFVMRASVAEIHLLAGFITGMMTIIPLNGL